MYCLFMHNGPLCHFVNMAFEKLMYNTFNDYVGFIFSYYFDKIPNQK